MDLVADGIREAVLNGTSLDTASSTKTGLDNPTRPSGPSTTGSGGSACAVDASGSHTNPTTCEAAKTAADPTFVENVGFKLGAKVVPGSVHRDRGARRIDFQVSDGLKTYPVTYHGLVPDTFTDASDIEVVVEGRLGGDGVIRATDVLAKCGSRYEATPKA